MRSFHLLSLLSSIFLLPCPPSQAQRSYGHERPLVRHRHINHLSSTFDAKERRDTDVPFTNFSDGRGACGITNGPGDFIVALNSAEYDNGAHCFEMITITANGKTAQAQITDECPGCNPGGLDFSQGLFEFFAPLDMGMIYGSWSYNSNIATSSSTPLPPTTLYTPTSTTTMATTSTTWSTASSTTTSLPSIVVPTSTSTSTSTSTTATIPTSTPLDPRVITQINLALVELGTLLGAAFEL